MQKELAATKSIRKDDLKAALEKAEMLHECYAKVRTVPQPSSTYAL